MIHPFIFLETPQGFISLQNARWIFFNLYVPPCAVKIFNFMLFTFLEDALNQSIFTYASVPQLKIRVEFFENLFPPRQKGWRKLWFALLKFNQKISKWPGKLIYLNYFTFFVWFAVFLNVMALQFYEQYLSKSVVLHLLPLICNHGNLTLKLYT